MASAVAMLFTLMCAVSGSLEVGYSESVIGDGAEVFSNGNVNTYVSSYEGLGTDIVDATRGGTRRSLIAAGINVPNDYLHPRRREQLCAGLKVGEVCATNATELQGTIERCKESQVCSSDIANNVLDVRDDIRIMIPRSSQITVNDEIVVRNHLTVHLDSHEGEATVLAGGSHRIFLVRGILYANRINFQNGYASTHGGAIHLADGSSKAYINHCTFLGNSAADGGTVIWNEGVLHMTNVLFSPPPLSIAPVYNDGILKQDPLYEVEEDVLPMRL